MIKRILTLCLCVFMLVGLLPIYSLAAETVITDAEGISVSRVSAEVLPKN